MNGVAYAKQACWELVDWTNIILISEKPSHIAQSKQSIRFFEDTKSMENLCLLFWKENETRSSFVLLIVGLLSHW